MAVEGDEAEISPMLSAAASDVDCGLSGFTQSTATTTVRTHHHLTAHRQSARWKHEKQTLTGRRITGDAHKRVRVNQKEKVCLWPAWRMNGEVERQRERERIWAKETVQSDCSCPHYFIFSYKLHWLPCSDKYLIGICCFICMLYNLGSIQPQHGSGCCTSRALSPTLPLFSQRFL